MLSLPCVSCVELREGSFVVEAWFMLPSVWLYGALFSLPCAAPASEPWSWLLATSTLTSLTATVAERSLAVSSSLYEVAVGSMAASGTCAVKSWFMVF